jgi:hypothetical protein
MRTKWRVRVAGQGGYACNLRSETIDRFAVGYIGSAMRTARIARKTHETDILVEVNLDGSGSMMSRPASAFSTIWSSNCRATR